MRFTRRAMIALAGLAGLAGCTAPGTESANEQQANVKAMTDRSPRHFNRDGEMTSPVKNESVSTGDLSTDYAVNPVSDHDAAGDGAIDDTTALQNAIDAAIADGKPLYLPPGDYYKTGKIDIQGGSDLTVFGDSKFQSRIVHSGDGKGFNVDGTTGLTFENLGIIGDPNATNASNQTGIALGSNNENVQIINCHIADWAYDGVYCMDSTPGFTVAHSVIENCGDDGINPGGGGSDLGTQDILIIGNRILDCFEDGVHVSMYADRAVVKANFIGRCNNGIGSFDSTEVLVVNNIIYGVSNDGVTDLGNMSTNFGVQGNFIIDPGNRGVQVSGGDTSRVIRNNRVVRPGGVGIDVVLDGTDVTGNRVVDATNQAFYIRGSADSSVSNNTAVNPQGRAGFEVRGMIGGTFTGNRVLSPTEKGILFVNCTSWSIVGNHAKGGNGFTAIDVQDSNGCGVLGNTAQGFSSGNGLEETRTSDTNSFVGNVIAGGVTVSGTNSEDVANISR